MENGKKIVDLGGVSVSISRGNAKMGAIPSVSLPPVVTCRPGAPCVRDCYACKLCRIRETVRTSYDRNYQILRENPRAYWAAVRAAVALSSFFRFHVSGDIPDAAYFAEMVRTAEEFPHCQMLAFTKQFEIVNAAVAAGVRIPENLHVIFSVWRGLDCVNPYGLPTAHVIERDGSTTAPEGATVCPGNCADCARTGCGCWTLKNGQAVAFHKH